MIDSLYHLCLYAYLKGNRRDATMYFDLLKDEFRATGKRGSLSIDQYKALKEIRQALVTGSISTKTWVQETGLAPGVAGTNANQDELVRRIHTEALPDLKSILEQDVWLENVEHPCPPYGRADMLYMSSDTAYPVEVKRKAGEHDLIGQILKYSLYMKLRLHYHHYNRVRPVTICVGYDPHVLQELRAYGVDTLVYYEAGSSLKVRKA